MKKLVALFVLFALLFPCFTAFAEEILPVKSYSFAGEVVKNYDSETLKFTVEYFNYHGKKCYVCKIWMANPAKQIKKATSSWQENALPVKKMIPESDGALVINGSGFMSPSFPKIPEGYPSSDECFFTPLGSITITNGILQRELPNLRFTGITLENDGLHMYHLAENSTVLGNNPTQTWSFFDNCCLIDNWKVVASQEKGFASELAARNIIAKVDNNNYVVLMINKDTGGNGIGLYKATLLLEPFNPEWAFNLDGGGSIALLAKNSASDNLKVVTGHKRSVIDAIYFAE